jgi:hypothetical protein
VIRIFECKRRCSRGDAVVSPETSEDLNVWEVNPLQELGKPLLGEEIPIGGVFSVYPVLCRDEKFYTGSFRSLSENLLLHYSSSVNGAEHDVDVLEDTDEGGFVRVVDLKEFNALVEPLGISSFDGFLFSEISKRRAGGNYRRMRMDLLNGIGS